jgi:hypothetical protein
MKKNVLKISERSSHAIKSYLTLLSVIHAEYQTFYTYAECCYAECHCAECHGALRPKN